MQVAADDNTPAVFASLDALLASLVRLASPDAVVAALRWALSLRAATLQARGRFTTFLPFIVHVSQQYERRRSCLLLHHPAAAVAILPILKCSSRPIGQTLFVQTN